MADTKVKAPTKVENFTEILAILEDAGEATLAAFVEKTIDQLMAKNGGNGAPTKAQLANMKLEADVLEAWPGDGMTATAIAAEFGVSVQKMVPRLTAMVKAGKVVKTEAKGKEKATFAVA